MYTSSSERKSHVYQHFSMFLEYIRGKFAAYCVLVISFHRCRSKTIKNSSVLMNKRGGARTGFRDGEMYDGLFCVEMCSSHHNNVIGVVAKEVR